jgi:VCBS repeat-containing protein
MKVLFSILLFTFCALGFAQTNVSEAISSDITWSLADSPFTVTGSILVSNGVTLTIEAGAVINFSDDYKILVKGNIISSGTSESLITFNGHSSEGSSQMIIFKSTNLSNSTITYNVFNGPQKAIQLADESEGNEDSTKNSGILTVTYSDFNNAGIYTKGYSTSAELKFENSTFDDLTIKGYYPRTEPITFTNCVINNSNINSDSYNYGINIYYSNVLNSSFTIGCCGANFLIDNSTIYNSPFTDYNNNYEVLINKSLIINSPLNLPSGNLTITSSIISFNGFDTSIGVNTRKATISNSLISGNGAGTVLKMNSYSNYSSTISNSTLINSSTSVLLEGNNGTYDFSNSNLHNNQTYNVDNNSDQEISAENNYWGTVIESEIQDLIFDSSDNIDKGTVDYTPFLTSLNIEAPISPPSNVTKSVTGSDVVLNWSANGESDIAGYKLHYGSPTGYSYATSVDLGNVTTYVVNGGDITTEYSITAYDSSIDGTDDMVDGNESWFSAANEVNITLMSSATSISEPTNSATLTVTINSTSSQDIVVNLVYTGTAINATDYTGASSITIAAGSLTGSIDIAAIDNTNIEVTKTIIIDVDTVTNASEEGVQQVSINLIDDDLPSVTLSYTPITFNEAGGISEIIATQSEITSNDTAISLDLSGTASNITIIEDFETTLPSGAINIANGVEVTIVDDPATSGVNGDVMKIVTSTAGEVWQYVIVSFQGDSLDLTTDDKVILVDVYSETAFTMLVKSTAPSNGNAEGSTDASHGGSGWETLTFDFSNPKDGALVANDVFGGIAFFPLWNGSGFNSATVTTTYIDNISTPNGGDYRISSRIINIPAGTSSATTTITGIEDSIFDEGDETIIITPVNPTNATLTSLEATTITITNKNYAPVAFSNQNNHYSINVISQGQSWETNLTQILEIIEGNTYTLTFDAWSDVNRSIYTGLGLSGNPGWDAILETINITPTKTTYSFTFEAIGIGNPEARVIFDLGADIGQVNIDNVSLVTSTEENIVLNGDFSSGSDYWVTGPLSTTPAPVVSTIDYVSATEKIEVAITLVGVDSENDALTYVIETLPVNGVLTDPNNSDVVVSAGDSLKGATVNYVSTSEIAEFDSFTFKVNDGELNSNTATISIAITTVNDPPVLSDDAISTKEDTSVNITLNVEDLDDTEFTYVIVSDVSNGSLIITDNFATYSPQEDFNGADSFTLIANDGEANSANAIISITVTAVNDAPVAVADTATVDEGNTSTTLENGETSLLHNDTDTENNPLTAILVSDPIYGALTLNTDGTFSYEHDGSDIASDYFTYKVNDGELDSNTVTVSIIINTVNDNFPTDIIVSNNFIDENLSGVTIGQFTAEDLDLPADIHAFELVSGAGDTNNTSFTITDNNLIINESFDYETQQSLSIRIKVIDEVNQSFERSFDILINNVNDISITSATTDSYCSGTSGTGSITISSIADTFGNLTFAWSAINGGSIPSGQETIQSLTEISDGTYSVTISDTSFSLTESFEIGLTPQYDELSICYVSSDETDETKNRIFLNNAGNYNVGIYEILRETNSANIYTSIGSMLSSENSFLDENSDNMSQSYNYKVRLIDYCGNQSPNSDFHKTILLQSSIAVNNSVNLNWSDYEGTDFGTYNIFRNTNSEGFNLIGSVSASNNSFNDAGADITIDNYEYYISISVDECLNDVSGKSNSKSSTEIKSNRLLFSNGTASVDDFNDLNQLVVFPNPSNDMLNIKLSEGITLYKVKIYNTLGQMVLETQDLKFPIENLASSTYFIKIFTSKGLTTRNFIKN